MDKLECPMDKLEWLTNRDYKVVSRAEFEAATDKPVGLLERANKHPGNWICYDPNDDAEGFMLIRNDREDLINEAYDYLEMDHTPPNTTQRRAR